MTNSAFNNNYIQYEHRGNKDKILTTSEYVDMIRPYLGDIINDHQAQGANNFVSSKNDSDEIRTMRKK